MAKFNGPLLHLVYDKDASGNVLDSRGHFELLQQPLLTTSRTLFLCTTDVLTEETFLSVVSELRPQVVIDLRLSPRFDFGNLNRKRVFALFEAHAITYFDIPLEFDGQVKLHYPSFDWPTVIDRLAPFLAGNVLVLADSSTDYRSVGITFAHEFRNKTAEVWHVVLNGPPEPPAAARDRIFISHANPDDNHFALWLQTQLARRGYNVWTDLTNLEAGDVFWNTIEDVIRRSAAKVIVVASHASMSKPGVLDEISLAVSVERSLSLERFVIPVRIDDLSFTDFRANIARKNTIDFSCGWARGLARLVETLELDRVPATIGSGASQLANWWHRRNAARVKISPRAEELTSNQFELATLPERLFLVTGLERAPSPEFPLCPFQDGWLSMYSVRELANLGVQGLRQSATITTTEFLSGNVSIAGRTRPGDRERIVIRLLNRAWEAFLKNRGFLQAAGRNGFPTAYIAKGYLDKDQAEFVDAEGTKRKRLLVGRSEKRKVHWHLGVIGRFQVASPYVLRLKLRVLFTNDGRNDLLPTERTLDLRRSFCKNWWNDRWYGLQAAMVAVLSQGQPTIRVHEGDCGALAVLSQPLTFVVPVGVNEESVPVPPDIEADDMDFGTLDEELDEWAADGLHDDDFEEVVA